MGKRRWLKRVFVSIGVLLLCVAVLLFLYPFWLPPVARPIAEKFGAHFKKFERVEGGRFALTDLVYTNESLTFRANRVEGYLPHAWYLHKGETNAAKAFLEVNGWKVLLHPAEKTAEPTATTNSSVYALYRKFEPMLALGREWLPKATLLNGVVEMKGQEYPLSLITLEHGQLEANGVWPQNKVPIEIKARLASEPYQISYAMYPLDLRARVRLFETNNAVVTELAAFYQENRVNARAEFGPDSGLLPVEATLTAPDFKLPAELVKLEGYQEVSGSLTGKWADDRYTVALDARAEPLSSASNRPPVDVEIQAAGDTNRVRVEKLLSTAPGLKVALSEPVKVDYRGQMQSGPSELAIDADFSKVPFGKLEGELKATVLLKPGEKLPRISLRARGANLGADVGARKIEAQSLNLTADLDWPRLENLQLDAVVGSNLTATASGAGDLQDRVLTNLQLVVKGRIPTNLLPTNISLGPVALEITASGPITNLAHAGRLELRNVAAPELESLDLQTRWKARNVAFEQLALQVKAGAAELAATGTGSAGAAETNFTFRELTLKKGDETQLALAAPFELRVTDGPRITAEALDWKGTNRELRLSGSIAWPGSGEVELAATNFDPTLFQGFVTRSLRGLEAPELRVNAGWSNGPVQGQVEAQASVEDERFGKLKAQLDARLSADGLMLTNLSVADRSGEVMAAKGFLPAVIDPTRTNGLLKLSKNSAIDFQARTAPSEHFWSVVGDLTKLNLSNPAVRVEVRGTLEKPAGELQLNVAEISMRQTNRELPHVGPVSARVTLNQQVLRIPQVEVMVETQRLALSGSVELGENFWTQPREQLTDYVIDHASLRLEAPDIQVAPFSRFFPQYLAPQGTVAIDARLLPGRELAGGIVVTNVQSRPISKIGVVENIQARLNLEGRAVQVQSLSAALGGQRLEVRGKIDGAEEYLAKGYPQIDLSIQGTNLPLARNPDVILRSDLNLQVKNGTNRVPVIGGDVTLRDSFLLADISTLVPGGVASPEKRPPYFSVPQPPVNQWTLDLRVRGDNFMRVRSPFFHGLASANFHVVGTLEEPQALGEATVSSGQVIFPFATLQMKQAIVSLTSENPYLPRVFVVAAGRAFGFDIRMEAEGMADDPRVQFSSVPALTSEQIILMLTTGQIPRDDFGFSRQDRAGKLAVFLGKSLWEKLNPGKPGEERLTIRSGEDITEQGKQTYEVEYKLTDRWSIVGEYDRFGQLNANVKWRLFSR